MALSGQRGQDYQAGFEEGRMLGLTEGQQLAKEKAIDWLQREYLNPAVLRGSARGQAILQLAKELSAELKS